MKVERFPVGLLQANCYLLTKGSVGLLIDPGADFQQIKTKIGTTTILAILITHHHFDHVGALIECQAQYSVPIIDFTCSRSQQIGPFSFEIIPTQGHSSDSVSFYFREEEVMFTGDFLFYHTIGRTDTKTGSVQAMKASLDRIKTYVPKIKVYPGHGERTTLEEEKRANPYF